MHPAFLATVAVTAMTANVLIPELRPYLHAFAYLVATLLCFEIAQDYDHSLMKLSWLMFAGAAFVLAVHLPLGIGAVAGWIGKVRTQFIALALVQMELACLLAGMVLTRGSCGSLASGFMPCGGTG